MRILQIIPKLDLGGGETMCETLCLALKKRENELLVVSLYHDETIICKRLAANGIKVVFLNKHKRIDFSIVGKIRRVIKEYNPDVIHTHLFALKYTIMATLLSRRKIIHTVHNEAKKEVGRLDRIFNGIFFRVGKAVPIALSEGICASIKKEYHLKNVPIVFNGIDLSHCIVKNDYDVKEKLIILSIGRLTKQKNFERLIRAFAQFKAIFPNSLLEIIGAGEMLSDLQLISETLEIQNNVLFVGEKNDVFPYLKAADIFCLSSDYEGLPMVLLEAMGTGLPTVSTNVGGISDLINDEKNGLLCSCDENDLFEKLCKLASSIKLREQLGKNATSTVAENFSSNSMAAKYLSLYEKVLEKK